MSDETGARLAIVSPDAAQRGRAAGARIEPPANGAALAPGDIDPHALIGALWRGKWTILLAVLAAMLLGGVYAFRLADPQYTASARLAFQVRNQQVVDLESVISGVSTEEAAINTELAIIRSRGLIERLVSELSLLEDPEFNPVLPGEGGGSLGTVRSWVSDLLSPEAGDAAGISAEAAALNETVRQVTEAVAVTARRDTFLFDIEVTTGDPRKSAAMANRLAEIYIDDQIGTKFAATEYAVDWLSGRVAELELELKAKEDAIKTLRAETSLISIDALEALNARMKDIRERLDRLGGADAATDADRSRQAAQRLALMASLTEIEEQIAEQNADLAALTKLRREADATRVLYDTFLARLKETSVQIGLQQADSRILSRAVPGQLVRPRKALIVAVSLLLGAMAGAALVLCRQFLHAGFRTGEALEATTGHPVLGQVPQLPDRRRDGLVDYLRDSPTSAAAEAIRNLRTSILLQDAGGPPRVLVFTSSVPGEGKTTLSIALAQNLASLGKRVLLIEGDIRRRTFSEYFPGLDAGALLSVIGGDLTLAEGVATVDALGADVLVGGTSARNAADVFTSDPFRRLIDEARAAYDFVLIDTPPVLVVPDARVIGQVADAILYVVRWDRTAAEQVAGGLRQFASVGLRVTGTVLTQIDRAGCAATAMRAGTAPLRTMARHTTTSCLFDLSGGRATYQGFVPPSASKPHFASQGPFGTPFAMMHRARTRRTGLLAHGAQDCRGDIVGIAGDLHARVAERGDLGGGAFQPEHRKRAGVAHAPSLRRMAADDQRDDRLAVVTAMQIGRGVFLFAPADLADQHHRLGLPVFAEPLQALDEAEPVQRVAAYADGRGLAEIGGRATGQHFRRQRGRARDDAHVPGPCVPGGHHADLAGAGRQDALAVGADQHGLGACQRRLDPGHVVLRHAFGHADHDAQTGLCRLDHRVGRAGRWRDDQAGIGLRLCHRLGDRVEDRQPEVPGTALARADARHDLGAVAHHLVGIERAGAAGHALHQDAGRAVHQDRHQRASRAIATTLAIAAVMLSKTSTGILRSCRIFRPQAAFCPARRTARGGFRVLRE